MIQTTFAESIFGDMYLKINTQKHLI